MMSSDPNSARHGWLRWIDRFSAALAIIGGVAALALMINVIVDVIGRSLFNRPLPPTLELTQFAWMPILISLGLGYALQRGEHIRVTLLTSPTTPRTQRVIEIISLAFTLATVGVLTYFTVLRAERATAIGEVAVGTPWIPVWLIRWIVVVGLIGFLLQTVAELCRAWMASEFEEEDEVTVALAQEESLAHEMLDDVGRADVIGGRESEGADRR